MRDGWLNREGLMGVLESNKWVGFMGFFVDVGGLGDERDQVKLWRILLLSGAREMDD